MPVPPDPKQWQQVESLFQQALEQPPEEVSSWLDRSCAGDGQLRSEVASLLESDEAAHAGFIGAWVQQAVIQHEESAPAMEGRRIGPYRLIREIGSGGMGAVYLADRDDQQYESRVAVKLVRPGFDTDFILRRFRRERQILARLEHPNITRLLDGGTNEDGTPWLVMEYIDGDWITRYAAAQGLEIDDRIRLFQPVCAAVQFAHRQFVVHRDLKPGNILVDRAGVPKLLDFGISKLLHSDPDAINTQGIGMMTPAYASPEQILGNPCTVSSDVYSLGAVLYELLTGVLPHRIEKCTPLALEQAICLDVVPAPSHVVKDRVLARALKGDLDNIIGRAMQKEPGRRYEAVEHLAEDLRRYLEHRPVSAQPDSPAYRIGKFVRRNRAVVSVSSLAIGAVLVGELATAREARIANQRFEDVRKLATTFVFDVQDAAANLPGALGIRKLIVRTGVEYLNNLARDSSRDWDLKRELGAAYLRIGTIQGGAQSSNLGDSDSAFTNFGKAGSLLDEVIRHNPADRKAVIERMAVYSSMSNLMRQLGKNDAATAATESAVRIGDGWMASFPQDPEVAEQAGIAHLDLARLRQQSGDLDRAETEAAVGTSLMLRMAAALPGDKAQLELAESHARLGSVKAALGRRDEALASYGSQVAVLETLSRSRPNDTQARHELMLAYSHIGDNLGNYDYDNAGDLPGAFRAYSKMAELAKYLYDVDPLDARAMADYGIALLRLGIATPIGGPAKRKTLEQSQEKLGQVLRLDPHNRTAAFHEAWVEYELGSLSIKEGDRASGVRHYRAALGTAEMVLAASPDNSAMHRHYIYTVRALAEVQAHNAQRPEALATLERGLAVSRKANASSRAVPRIKSINAARAAQTAGAIFELLGMKEGARLSYRQALEEWRKAAVAKGFVSPDRKEMEATRQALAKLEALAVERGSR